MPHIVTQEKADNKVEIQGKPVSVIFNGTTRLGEAMAMMNSDCLKSVDVKCISHLLDLVGEKFTAPHLLSFMGWWVSLFSHSPKSTLLWKEKTDQAYRSYSATRWWSKFKVMNQAMDVFGDVQPFFEENAQNNFQVCFITRKREIISWWN